MRIEKAKAPSPRGERVGVRGDHRLPEDKYLTEILSSGANKLGVTLSDAQLASFFLYLSELKKWNRKINLTAIREDREIIIKHFLDSLAFLRGFAPSPGMKLLDMGSGAGFPALPIKIAFPEIIVTMVESVKKKASFLRHIIRTLSLPGAEVLDKRTEELPDLHQSRYDIVTARAFADMEAALITGVPFLKPGGLMVLSRGPEESIDDEVMKMAGVTLESRLNITLPYSDHKRAVWVFKKSV